MKRWLTLFPVICLVLFMAACGDTGRQEEQTEGVLIHYVTTATESGDAVLGVARDLDLPPDAPLETQVRAVVEFLMKEPTEAHLHSPFPESVELLGRADRSASP